MRKTLLTIFCSIFIFLAQSVLAENVAKFDVGIVVNDDATIDVTETILYDFGNVDKHGIYRDIPVKYKTDTGNKRSVRLFDILVTDENGNVRTFTKEQLGKNIRIKIGDADKYVTGKQVYDIQYTVDGAINYFDDHDELYWNITGDEWNIELNDIVAVVQAVAIDDTRCFRGQYGSTDSCDTNITPKNGTVQFGVKHLSIGEGMTVVVGMPVGTVYKPSFFAKILWFARDNWIIFTPFVVLGFMWRRWKKYGKDSRGRGTIVPHYEEPDDLSPAEVGMIMNEEVHKNDISALLIDLAVRGYIHIKKSEEENSSQTEYTFIKTGKIIDNFAVTDEKLLYELLFQKGNGSIVKLSDLKNVFHTDMAKVKQYVITQSISNGYYDKNPRVVRGIYIAIAVILIFVSIVVGGIVGLATGFSVFLSASIIAVFGYFMPRVTKKGALVREQIEGLKLYMETAEKDRINFHNAPEKKPERFEKLLPYAMVLGVEKAWAKQFENMYHTKPQWYEGTGTFSSVVLAQDLSSFSGTASSTLTSAPSSSASGGSGFSGGGSGGGGGGGGGGSW